MRRRFGGTMVILVTGAGMGLHRRHQHGRFRDRLQFFFSDPEITAFFSFEASAITVSTLSSRSSPNNGFPPFPDCPQHRLVDNVSQLCTGGASRRSGNHIPVDVWPRPDILSCQDGFASRIGKFHRHPAVKPPGTQQRWIQALKPVGGCQHHPLCPSKPSISASSSVRVLTFIEPPHHRCFLRPMGVNFVDKDDGGLFHWPALNGSHLGSAHADKHLHKDSDSLPEWRRKNARLPGSRFFCQQGFCRCREATN